MVHVERRTTQAHANQRWCYVVATETGTAGFCEERYLAIDPPEPTATLRRTTPGERLAAIAAEAFGTPTDENNARLQVQVLYLANRDRTGVKLDHVDLGFKDRGLRGEAEEQILEGAFNAVVDLFKGAVEMVEAVLKVVWNLVTGNLGRIKDMVTGWIDKMKAAWEHRGEIADEFLKRWNAESMWDRGLFQGEVLGWIMMTVLLILLTIGEDAPAAVTGIVTRWPQLVKLLKTVDTLGDVTTYVGAAAKIAKVPAEAAGYVACKLGRTAHAAEHVAEDVSRAGKKTPEIAEHARAISPKGRMRTNQRRDHSMAPARHTSMMNRSRRTGRSSGPRSTLGETET